MHRTLAEAIDLFSQGVARSNRPEDRNIATTYLANLAPLLASAVLGKDILRELDGMERLFSNTSLVDLAPFEPALEKWREFRDEYEQFALAPMTVNERLTALGLDGAFDRARAANDIADIQRILRRVRVDDSSIAAIVAQTGMSSREHR